MLRGPQFLPESQTQRLPLIIIAHGTSVIVTIVADKYAGVFSRASLAALLYAQRNFGRSEGEPRQEINTWIQCRGYLDAVKLAETLDGIDPERIALWGDSYTGGQIIVVGAIEPHVKVIVAQCPVFGAEPPEDDPNTAIFDLIKETLLQGDVTGTLETTIGPMPVVSSDSTGQIVDILEKISVRSKMVIEHQSPAIQQQILEYILSEIDDRRVDGNIKLTWPALLKVVQKPGQKGKDYEPRT